MKHFLRSSRTIVPALVPALVVAAGLVSAPTADAKTLVDAVKGGTLLINIRYRYENVDMDAMNRDAHANTVRTRIGYRTDWWQGLQATVEFENITVVGEEKYNDTMSGKPYPVVVDPEDTELDQGFVAFRGIKDTSISAGRQRINFLNQRFIGSVLFRQNDQTLDSVMITNKSIPNLTARYLHIWNVNRVFGNDSTAGDWNSNITWGQLSYKTPLGTLTGYTLFLDVDEQSGGAFSAFSSKTFGGRFQGKTKITDGVTALYAFDYAHQNDLGDNMGDYSLDYYLIEPGVSFAGLTAKLGYEVLEGDWINAFQTPLGTLHAFQGAADLFLVTPARGIEDAYTKLKYKVSNLDVLSGTVLSFVYHNFDSNAGHTNYGSEWGVKIARKLKTDYGTVAVSAEHANFNADNDNGLGYQDVHKTWLTVSVAY